MRVYLDNCCFNRPFDNQEFIRVKLETEAKLHIQEKIINKKIELVWSYILEYENAVNPFEIRQKAILFWKDIANIVVTESPEIISLAKNLQLIGLKSKDSLHVACSVISRCDYFLTTDDAIIRKLEKFDKIKVINPLQFIYLGCEDENK